MESKLAFKLLLSPFAAMHEKRKVTNRAQAGTNRAQAGTNRLREPVTGMPKGGAGGAESGAELPAPRSFTPRAPANLRTHADQVQHPCRPPSTPVLNRYILFSISFFSSSIYLWVTPRGPIPLPDRSSPFVRNFRPLIPAHDGRRLPSRLDG
jgi:hypothetical protein